MKKLNLFVAAFLLTAPTISLADTPAPGVIKIKGGTDGATIGNTGDALKVSGSFTASGSTTVVQPTGTNLHSVVDNFPVSQAVTGTFFQATQPVSGTFFQATQPVSGTLGRSWSLGFSGDKVDASGSAVSVSNFPATQPVTGTFFQATQPVSISGSVPVTGALTDTQLRASAVPVSAASLPLPTGAATSALQSATNSILGSPFQAGGSIANTAFGISGTLPAYAATPTFNLGTLNGAALDASVTSLSAKFGSLGQKLMTGSAPVVIASDQSSIPVTGNFFQATQPVSGSVSVSNFPATQPISAASLPLPSGAATSALQTTGNSSLASIDSKITAVNTGAVVVSSSALPTGAATSAKQPALGVAGTASADVITVQGIASMTALKVDGSAVTQPVSGTFFQATQPVSAASLPLPALAATSTKQSDGSQKSQVVDGAGSTVGPIQTLSGTNYMPVVLAASATSGAAAVARSVQIAGSDGTNAQTIATNTGGQLKAAPNLTGSGSGAGATVSTVATLTAPANAVGFILMNLDTSTTNMRWAVGRTASATLGQQLQPGRSSDFVPVGANVSIIAESGIVNFDIQWISQ